MTIHTFMCLWFGLLTLVLVYALFVTGDSLLIVMAIASALASYVAYAFGRDERLDAEDEKYDRIHGEKQT